MIIDDYEKLLEFLKSNNTIDVDEIEFKGEITNLCMGHFGGDKPFFGMRLDVYLKYNNDSSKRFELYIKDITDISFNHVFILYDAIKFNNHSFIIRHETFDDHKAYVLTIGQEEGYGQSLEVEFKSFEVNQID